MSRDAPQPVRPSLAAIAAIAVVGVTGAGPAIAAGSACDDDHSR